MPLSVPTQITRAEVRERITGALERRVLGKHNPELRGYFDHVIEQMASPYLGSGEDDAISGSSDEDLEQTALLLCHHDADGDGLLSREEFGAIVDQVASQTSQSFSAEHVERCFLEADVDGSGAIDLNELCLYRAKAVGLKPRR